MLRALTKKSGVSLLETVVVTGIFLIIAASGTRLLLYANDISGRIIVKNELLENARIALDFMVNQLRYSENYRIETNGNIMQSITIAYRETDTSQTKTTHTFKFDAVKGVLSFGNQQLAGNIREIRLERKNDCLFIYVTTFDSLSGVNIIDEPIILTGIVRLKSKRDGGV